MYMNDSMRKAAEKMAEGFRFLENNVYPASLTVKGDTYIPPEGLQTAVLQNKYMQRLGELRGLYGEENVWVGPMLAEAPPSNGYSKNEHAGFYVRGGLSGGFGLGI